MWFRFNSIIKYIVFYHQSQTKKFKKTRQKSFLILYNFNIFISLFYSFHVLYIFCKTIIVCISHDLFSWQYFYRFFWLFDIDQHHFKQTNTSLDLNFTNSAIRIHFVWSCILAITSSLFTASTRDSLALLLYLLLIWL